MSVIVSVITPCYNGASYIADCIESVLIQTFRDWEMIIVDDCSTDESAKIISEYQTKDSRIKYFCTDCASGGPSVPRNIGIKQSKGEYISFLDCDDIWLPNKLEEQIHFAMNYNYDFIYSDYEKVSQNGVRTQRIIQAPKSSTYHKILKSNSIPCLTVFLSKRIICNTCFKQIPKEDLAFWLEILKKGVTAYNTGHIHALYRELPLSRSSNKFSMIKQQWFILRKVEGIPIIYAAYCMILYIIKGLKKYLL